MSVPTHADDLHAPQHRHHGILVIDKPLGMSSMHVCRIIRRRLRAAGAPKRSKVGHAGTLDPLASGVLVVLVGRATRRCDTIMAGRKRYLARVDLAHVSDTDDLEGRITPVPIPCVPTRGEVELASRGFVGAIEQTPPAHSALWVAGERAYDIARRGDDPGLRARVVHVEACEVTAFEWPFVDLDIRCGKGTYIRSLARDLGKSLHTGGMLVALRRTEVGPYSIDQAVDPDALPDPLQPEHLRPL